MSKLDELLAETDKEIIDYGAVTLTPREYDLLRSALREWEGMVLVPREPTAEMVNVGYSAMRTDNVIDSSEQGRVSRIYRAMLAAAEGQK